MEGFEVLVAMVTVLAAVMLFFSAAAYRRVGSSLLRFVLAISVLFFIKGLALTLWIFTDTPRDMSDILAFSLLIDFAILLFLLSTGFRGAKTGEEQRTRDKEEPQPGE
jgi:hypothetical protein